MKTVINIIERHVDQVEPLIGNKEAKNHLEVTAGSMISMLRGDVMLAKVLHEEMRGSIERMGYKMPDVAEFVKEDQVRSISSTPSSQTPALDK